MGRLIGKYKGAYTDEMDHPRFRHPSPDGGYKTDHLTSETSESTSEPDPAPTPERAEAKERAQNFKADIRGDEGIDFSTDDPNNEERKNKYELNLLQQQVPGS